MGKRSRYTRAALAAGAGLAVCGGAAALYLIAGLPGSSALPWESPHAASQIVDEFEAIGPSHPGFRRNHAKGVCVSGHFESSGLAVEISRAGIFESGVTPVIGRFSIAGGNPSQADGLGTLRSMALSLEPPGGQPWRMAMNSAPIFPVNTLEALVEQLRAMRLDPKTRRPDPDAMSAFLDAHPEAQAYQDWVDSHPPSSGFDNGAYFSVNAFRVTDAQGQVRNVRWSMVPQTPYAPVDPARARGGDPDFLGYALAQRLAQGPARWHLLITVAAAGDPTADASRLWPQGPERRVIDAGTLVIDHAQSQVDGACRDVDFNPLVLPQGIAPSDDPLLLARPAAYAESFKRRIREGSSP